MVLRKCRKGAAGSVQLRRSKHYLKTAKSTMQLSVLGMCSSHLREHNRALPLWRSFFSQIVTVKISG